MLCGCVVVLFFFGGGRFFLMILFCFVCFCLFFVKGACIFIFYSVRKDRFVWVYCSSFGFFGGTGFMGCFVLFVFVYFLLKVLAYLFSIQLEMTDLCGCIVVHLGFFWGDRFYGLFCFVLFVFVYFLLKVLSYLFSIQLEMTALCHVGVLLVWVF